MSEIKKLTADVDVGEFCEQYVNFEEVSKLCIEEQETLGYNWNYPPFDFDVDEVWNSYGKLKIIAFKIDFSPEELEHTFQDKELEFVLKRFERMKVKLMNEIYMLENEDSLGLFLGKCNLCMRCTREFGMPCKMPFKMRYSLESLGTYVDRMIEDVFGYEILYAHDGKLPEYLSDELQAPKQDRVSPGNSIRGKTLLYPRIEATISQRKSPPPNQVF
jgi:predicted metal-binding protein